VRSGAAPAVIRNPLADSRKHTAVTAGKASISKKIGGRFTTTAVARAGESLMPARSNPHVEPAGLYAT